MEKTAYLLAALLFAATLSAQDRVVERTYISTDRDVYVAGDIIWYSAFCLDAGSGALSAISGVGYVELHDATSMVASGKFDLSIGRGSGRLAIPGGLPTGNYRLVAYTMQNRAEKDYDYNGIASKTISVFNVFSNDRVADGVEVVSDEEYQRLAARAGAVSVPVSAGLSLSVAGDSLVLVNNGTEAATLCLSVAHNDGFLPNANPTIADFVDGCRKVGPRSFDNSVIPEYEGEIIHGHISGFSEEMIPKLVGRHAFISTPSDKSEVYSALIGEDGKVDFFTGNIYGTKEYICEIEGIDPSLNCFIELTSPFVGARVAPPAPLRMAPVLREPLLERSVAMQVERRFTGDTLLDPLPVQKGSIFGDDDIVYILDDYTRFTTMQEVFVEFVQEVRARRKDDGSPDIQVKLYDSTEPVWSRGRSLMMLDGVPVFDHRKIMDYDPLLVESIHIYPHTYFIGTRTFEGVVNFVTYKHNLPAFTFGGNVRVVDWQGVSWPMAFTGASLEGEEGYPDYRRTIYWHPLLELAPGQRLAVPVRKPDYKGRFKVTAEGLSASGKPLAAGAWLETE